MVGLEDDPASYWESVTFQEGFLLNFGGVAKLWAQFEVRKKLELEFIWVLNQK